MGLCVFPKVAMQKVWFGADVQRAVRNALSSDSELTVALESFGDAVPALFAQPALVEELVDLGDVSKLTGLITRAGDKQAQQQVTFLSVMASVSNSYVSLRRARLDGQPPQISAASQKLVVDARAALGTSAHYASMQTLNDIFGTPRESSQHEVVFHVPILDGLVDAAALCALIRDALVQEVDAWVRTWQCVLQTCTATIDSSAPPGWMARSL